MKETYIIGKSGSDHPRWKGGRYITTTGYIRIAAGRDRGKYEHRAVMEKLLGGPIPPGMEVHHQDGNRAHNCPHNLLLLPKCLHTAAFEKRQAA